MTPTPAFTVWSNFYVITGSSAAALTGLMFVVVTLTDRARTQAMRQQGLAAFSTPTVVHLAAAFFVSAIVSAPWPAPMNAGVVLGLAGLAGIVYVARAIQRMLGMRARYEPDLEDWLWFAVLPLVSYVAIATTALLLMIFPQKALFALGGAVLLLIFIGIHNAWDLVTFVAIMQLEEQENADDKPPA